ncbi:MAG: hypothetical protein ACWA5L_11090 [bacterium]
MKTKSITLIRKPGYYAIFRSMGVYVDGVKRGNVKSGKQITIEIDTDAKEIYGKIDWAKTNKFSLENVPDGARLVAKSWFTLNLLRTFGIPTMPIHIHLEK